MKFTYSFLVLGSFSLLLAGPIEKDYNKTKHEQIINRGGKQKRVAQLNLTLTKAMQQVVLYNFQDDSYKEIELKPENYEVSELDPLTYYVKFRNYIGYFTFENNPEYYMTRPIGSSILLKSKESKKNKNINHLSNKTGVNNKSNNE